MKARKTENNRRTTGIHRAIPLLVGLLLAARLEAASARTLSVDVLVVGGTPAGIAAATAAARLGRRVHLVEPLPKLGGVITWAWLTTFDMNLSPEGAHLTRGIFLEYYKRLGLSFDLDEAVDKLTWAVWREPLVGSTTNAPLLRLLREGDRIAGAEFEDRDWQRTLVVRAKQVVDATDDAELGAAAGVPYVLGKPGPDGKPWMQPATLIFRVRGVDWGRLVADLLRRRAAGADPARWGVNGKAAWGYPEMAQRYRPTQPQVGLLGLNLALQNDGSVLVNALQVYSVNGLDPESTALGMERARRELPHVVRHLREHVPGFEQAELAGWAPMLYIRETRHIRGLYTLTAEDILRGRRFEDRIALASYPIDIHPYVPGWANPYPPVRITYSIPLRSLIPLGMTNLLVASRSFSATSEAAGSARVIPTTMAMGQAAGVVAAFCARRGCTPTEVARRTELLREVQRLLRAQGAYLGE
ncbi:MAG: FAD-dependent oxidoreductase [Armatimonadota bacterium]|nr:FAD-dependent oxidoreductase [Armatimonadota bacterium]MDR7438477.1 FAD-dependent oxidoreductase [Armatimonadota bacterium]MDR7563174.1 FAD-dependent oxidoreductase [Armatimonadota bacterium]MDR7568031.1 FAD-dependent oxidoreductase [Armatimonadota bacterium]MDR7602019.1 FAD-dependent oxidoreductase [Armatimonadota bacterium]